MNSSDIFFGTTLVIGIYFGVRVIWKQSLLFSRWQHTCSNIIYWRIYFMHFISNAPIAKNRGSIAHGLKTWTPEPDHRGSSDPSDIYYHILLTHILCVSYVIIIVMCISPMYVVLVLDVLLWSIDLSSHMSVHVLQIIAALQYFNICRLSFGYYLL